MTTMRRSELQSLLIDVFLLDPSEFNFSLHRDEIDTWDSLALYSVSVGVRDTFGVTLSPDELAGVDRLEDFAQLIARHGVEID